MSHHPTLRREIIKFTAATFGLAAILIGALLWSFGHMETDQSKLLGDHAEAMSGLAENASVAGMGEAARASIAELDDHLDADVASVRRISVVGIGGFFLIGVLVFGYQTQRRLRLEQLALAAQRFEHMGVMAAGTAHDFDNILTVISGNAGIMRAGLPEESPLNDNIREVEAAVESAAELTRQFRAYAGMGSESPTLVDLNVLVAESVKMVKVLIPDNVKLSVNPSESMGPLWADRGQIRQVVLNLVKNALDELGDSEGTIEVRTQEFLLPRRFPGAYVVEHEAEPGRYAALTVSDSGSGIPKSQIENVFNPYASSKGVGRGLGLASVAGIVRSHRGAVVVKSSEETGTSFTVLLPLAGASPEVLDSEEPEDSEPTT